MKNFIVIGLLLLLFETGVKAQPASDKLRVMVLTDIENEPDDTQSTIRFLTYSNNWDVEGLVATTSVHKKDKPAPEKIRELVNAYGQIRDNLMLHEKGYPEEKYLLNIVKQGYSGFGMMAVGAGKDSEGSDWIIAALDKKDNRPLWVCVWGGSNCLAQALWKIKMTRPPKQLEEAVAKLRVHTISDQDDAGPWIRKTFPNLFYIVSPGYHAAGAYHYSTWAGISGDKFHGRFTGANFSIVNNPWLDENVRNNHGPLGAKYPITKFMMEGDTPSFLGLINNGLNDPEHPDYGGWGGRYEYYTPRLQKWFYEPETRPIWSDAVDEVLGVDSSYHTSNKATIWRWREAVQNDFAARMDWTVKGYKEANHPPKAALNHPAYVQVKTGETISLDASNSTDPDGNKLSFEWMYYAEAGSYKFKDPLEIKNKYNSKVSLVAPKVVQPETVHVILKVTDNGTPALTRYQRVIIAVLP